MSGSDGPGPRYRSSLLPGVLEDANQPLDTREEEGGTWLLKRARKQAAQLSEELTELQMQLLQATEADFRRAKAERALVEALDRERAILDTIPDMAWLKDREGKFLAANEAFLKALGIDRDALAGRTDFDYWPAELARRFLSDDVEVMRSGRPKRIEETLIHAQGEPVWIETIKSPIYSDCGGVIGTVGIARDITAEKLAQEEKERLVAELQQALDRVKRLRGLLPICASCKKIRDDKGYWQQIEEHIRDHSEVDFSHGLCPDCASQLFPRLCHGD